MVKVLFFSLLVDSVNNVAGGEDALAHVRFPSKCLSVSFADILIRL